MSQKSDYDQFGIQRGFLARSVEGTLDPENSRSVAKVEGLHQKFVDEAAMTSLPKKEQEPLTARARRIAGHAVTTLASQLAEYPAVVVLLALIAKHRELLSANPGEKPSFPSIVAIATSNTEMEIATGTDRGLPKPSFVDTGWEAAAWPVYLLVRDSVMAKADGQFIEQEEKMLEATEAYKTCFDDAIDLAAREVMAGWGLAMAWLKSMNATIRSKKAATQRLAGVVKVEQAHRQLGDALSGRVGVFSAADRLGRAAGEIEDLTAKANAILDMGMKVLTAAGASPAMVEAFIEKMATEFAESKNETMDADGVDERLTDAGDSLTHNMDLSDVDPS